MSQQNDLTDNSGQADNLENQVIKTRDKDGKLLPGFNPQIEAMIRSGQVSHVQSGPTTTDYVKMNTILAKQLGLQAKLADFQTKHTPKELFRQLSFMAENVPLKGGQIPPNLPPNEPKIPITPEPQKMNLPGIPTQKENITAGPKFELHRKFPMTELLKGQKEK